MFILTKQVVIYYEVNLMIKMNVVSCLVKVLLIQFIFMNEFYDFLFKKKENQVFKDK